MNDKTAIHWSFWIIGVAALIWYLMGIINFFMQMNADAVASMPETHRAIIEGRPIWATAAFAVAVFGGALGAILLLLRKSVAYFVFILSLLGVIVTMIHTLWVPIRFSSFEVIMMILMPLIVAAYLISYSKAADKNCWLY